MAIMKIDLFSKVFRRAVTVEALVPVEQLQPGETCKALYLLHGVQGSYVNWITSTNLYRQIGQYNAEHEKKLAVIMPSGANSFYQSGEVPGRSVDYEGYIGSELIELTRAMLPLAAGREDTAIAGLSMGGYGALRLGLMHADVFGFAAGFSSALITQDLQAHCNEEGAFFEKPAFLNATFGDLRNIEERDVLALSRRTEKKPRLYISCGTEDRLLPLSRGLHEAWLQDGTEHTYEEHVGGHDWAFWEWSLGRILEKL